MTSDIEMGVKRVKRIELSYSMFEGERIVGSPNEDFSGLIHLFPITTGVEVMPPYLVITVRDYPQKPWPLTVGGLPIQFRQDESAEVFHRGTSGRGPKVLDDVDLRVETMSDEILRTVGNKFVAHDIKIKDIYWFSGFWRVTVPDNIPRTQLPCLIGKCPAYYRKFSEAPDPDPAALRGRPLHGTVYDDTSYYTSRNALLRPGITLSSSRSSTGTWKSTTSGILVANLRGEIFITVAFHGFEKDGWVYHPDPNGDCIGRIVDELPETDISIVKLNSGLRYVNETFGSGIAPNGIRMLGIIPDYPPHLRIGDTTTMNNPFAGYCEGTIIARGLRRREDDSNLDLRWVVHEWVIFENGEEPIDGSCGAPILHEDGRVIAFCRLMGPNGHCLSVSALQLREYGYEICGGTQTFP